MRAMRKFSLTLAGTAILLLLAVAITSLGANLRLSQSTAGKPSHANAETTRSRKSPPVPQELFCPLWRTDHTFEATIRIKNELVVAPLTVAPVLFMADGTEYDLEPVSIDSADVVTISINDALSQAPTPIQPHLSQFGSASLRFLYGWSAVSASIQSLDRPGSLIHQYPFVHSMSMSFSHQVLAGLWWKHDPGVDGFVALSNTTAAAVDAHIGLSDSRGLDGPGSHLMVPAHGTQLLQLSELDPDQWRDQEGGVTVSWEGETNALTVAGGLENTSEGFSAPMVFRTLHTGKPSDTPISFASVGIMVGNPDRMMGFPSGTRFTPYAILRNGGSDPLDIQPTLYYLQGMTTTPLRLKGFMLSARQTTSLDVNALLGDAGLKNYSGTIHLEFSYRGNSGALIIATGSVDQTGTYVFDVSAKGINQDRGKRISYWENGGGTDTMFTLWNPKRTPQDLLVTLYFHGGTYKLPVHINANGTYMFNISELATNQKPDQDGNVLPSGATIGSALITDGENRLNRVTIVVSAGTFNVQNATCAEQCSGCDDIQQVDLNPYYPTLLVGSVQQLTAACTFPDGTITDCTSAIYNWGSSSSSAAVSDSGAVTAVDTGSAFIQGYLDETITDSLCYTQGICDYSTLLPYDSVTVAPAGFSISVTSAPVEGETNSLVSGQSGQVKVTVLGAHGNTAINYTGTVHFSSTDTGATLPSDYTYSGSDAGFHTFNVTLKSVSGNSASRDLKVNDGSSGVSFTQNINLWFQVIATREGLVGSTTACNHVITQNDHFVALPATGMCNIGVRLRNGGNLATTSVLDVGPWCPNTPVPGGFNQCSCPSDLYWQTSGVPFAATASCATSHAGIDLADGTFTDLGLTGNTDIYWRFQ